MNPVKKNPSDEHSQCVAYSINNAVFLVLFAKSFGLPGQDTYFFIKSHLFERMNVPFYLVSKVEK